MAEATDVLTLAEARAALNQGSAQTNNDTRIAALVSAISQRLDDSSDGVGPIVTRIEPEATYDGEGTAIQLNSWPVSSVTSVTEDAIALTSVQYHLDGEKGLLYRRDGDYDDNWCVGRDNVAVVATVGRYASTATVTEFYKQGARLLLKHLWRAEQWNVDGIGAGDFDVPQVAFPSFSIPNAVKDWFGGEWRGKKGGFV